MKKTLLFIFAVVLIITGNSCATTMPARFNPTKKYSADVLQTDLSLLQNILEKNHPSLYWYTPKDSIDYFFSLTRASIKDSLTENQFKNKMSWLVSKIRCGHTVVRNSKKYNRYFANKRLPHFPLSLKVWGDSAVVINNYFRGDSVLKRGTIVTGINGLGIKRILDSLYQTISTDGHSLNFKQQLVSFNFPAYYKNSFGVDTLYKINYIDSTGRAATTIVKNYHARVDTLNKKRPSDQPNITRREFRKLNLLSKRSMLIDTSLSTAILSVNTFSGGHLQSFFKRSFKAIKRDKIKNVVIDLRLNSGGSVLASTRLIQYMADAPFHIADTIAAFTRSMPYKAHVNPWFIYWFSMHFSGKKNKDGRIHFRFFENHQFRPKTKNHFEGNVYLVTGGYTFSAATLVTGSLKGQQNVTVVGEETGGGAYGNSAMHIPIIELPSTGVRVSLPLYRLVINSKLPKNGRGIMPDVEVKPTSASIKNGVDLKFEKVRQLIIAKQKDQ